jgi:hypothetical protein
MSGTLGTNNFEQRIWGSTKDNVYLLPEFFREYP